MPFAQFNNAGRHSTRAFLALVVVLSIVAASGCGKPAYCKDRTNLDNSVKNLPSAATTGGVNGLEAQLNTVQTNADTLESSAKDDFPDETSAIKSSVDQLQASVSALPPKPPASQIAAVAINTSAVVHAVKTFHDATEAKCK